MIEDAVVKERVIRGVRGGQYSLLLGAGFSTIGKSSQSLKNLPTTGQFVEELASHFGFPSKYSLGMLWDALPQQKREKYLYDRFKNCIVENGDLPINLLIWKSIYTFNVDDVVETIYDNTESQQILNSISYKDTFRTPDSLGSVHCIHLHGSVLSPEDGYIFSTKDYGRSTTGHKAWWPVLADSLATDPFIVVGCTLDEYDLEHHLARRGPVDASTELTPSLFVTRTLDEVLISVARKFGLIPIQAEANDFFKWLCDVSKPLPTVDDIIKPKNSLELYISQPSEKEQRIFHRQFLYVNDGEFPSPIEEKHNFLRGFEPTWNDILSYNDIKRVDTATIFDAIKKEAESDGDSHSIFIIQSPPGCGKSTLLMRIAYECSRFNIPTFYFSGTERLSTIAASQCLSRMRRRAVVFIDLFRDHATQISQLVENLDTNTPLLIVGAERDSFSQKIRTKLSSISYRTLPVHSLQRSEAVELIQKLRDEGLLGRKASENQDQLIEKTTGRDLLIALCEITSHHNRFDDILKSVWSEQVDVPAKTLLAAAAISHAHGYPLKFSIAQSISGISVFEIRRLISSGSLHGVIMRVGVQGEYLQLQHRILAERLILTTIPEEILFNTYVSIAKSLAPYVSRDTIKRMTNECKIARRILDYKPYLKKALREKAKPFYTSIKNEWSWNSRYWEQVSLLELDLGNFKIAISNAEQAVSIENHPMTRTTLGKVLMKSAISASGTREGRANFFEALQELETAIQLRKDAQFRYEHAHHILLTGIIDYIKKDKAMLSHELKSQFESVLADAKASFPSAARTWAAIHKIWDKVLN